MIKRIKKALVTLSVLVGAVALLSLAPAGKIEANARGPEVALGIDVHSAPVSSLQ